MGVNSRVDGIGDMYGMGVNGTYGMGGMTKCGMNGMNGMTKCGMNGMKDGTTEAVRLQRWWRGVNTVLVLARLSSLLRTARAQRSWIVGRMLVAQGGKVYPSVPGVHDVLLWSLVS